MFSNLIGLSLGVLGWVSYAVFCVWGFLKIASSRREHPCAPRNPWQKLWKFWICSVRAATPCWRRELLGRKLEIFVSAQLAPRPLVGAANCLAESWGFWIRSVRAATSCWRREPSFAEFFLNFEMMYLLNHDSFLSAV